MSVSCCLSSIVGLGVTSAAASAKTYFVGTAKYILLHFTNASALAVKYGTRRDKPAGNAIEFCLFCLLAM